MGACLWSIARWLLRPRYQPTLTGILFFSPGAHARIEGEWTNEVEPDRSVFIDALVHTAEEGAPFAVAHGRENLEGGVIRIESERILEPQILRRHRVEVRGGRNKVRALFDSVSETAEAQDHFFVFVGLLLEFRPVEGGVVHGTFHERVVDLLVAQVDGRLAAADEGGEQNEAFQQWSHGSPF